MRAVSVLCRTDKPVFGLPDGQESGIEDATRFVGFLALVVNLSFEIVPAAEKVTMSTR